MSVKKSQLKACNQCGVVWDSLFHTKCPNGHIGLPREIDWDS